MGGTSSRTAEAAWPVLEEVTLLQLATVRGEAPRSGVDGQRPSSLGDTVEDDEDENDEDEDEDDEGDEDEWARLFDSNGSEKTAVCEGQVVARSAFKVVRTVPRGVVGRVEVGKTRVRVQCCFAASTNAAPLADARVDKVLLHAVQRDGGDARGWASAVEQNPRVCLDALQQVVDLLKSSGSRLHVTEGQSVFTAEGHSFVVRACEPRRGGIICADTEIHFDVRSQIPQVQHVRLLPVDDTVVERAGVAGPLGALLASHLRERSPMYVERGQRLWFPVFQREVPPRGVVAVRTNNREIASSSSSSAAAAAASASASASATLLARGSVWGSREEVRQRRLAYYDQRLGDGQGHPQDLLQNSEQDDEQNDEANDEHDVNVSEVFMVQWRVVDVSPDEGGLLSGETRLYTDANAAGRVEDLVDAQLDEDGAGSLGAERQEVVEGTYESAHEGGDVSSLCLRCGGLAEAPRDALQCTIFCCPCGQPIPNPQSPLWQSVDHMLLSAREAQRPSVLFLHELREVIAVMPMRDARTPVLHSSLNVFPTTADGGVDFNQADRLVLLIMPSLRRRSRGVDPGVLARLPVSRFASIRESALRRGETSCCICMQTYVDDDELRTLPCFHFMHKTCVDRWLGVAKTCPICKYAVE